MNTTPKNSRLTSQFTQAGRAPVPTVKVANPAVQRASTVLFETVEQAWRVGELSMNGARHLSTYGTVGTETTFALCDALEQIEGSGHAVRAALQPSGLAAISTALQAFLSPGDHLLMPDSVYGPARMYAEGMLTRWGVITTFFNPVAAPEAPDSAASLCRPNTKVLYLESPGSYTFEIPDVPALAAWARAKGLISMIDNAWGSPLYAKPFDWGVDVSVLPLTKYWSGHSDVLMGAVVVREALWERLFHTQRSLGICVGGDDAYLVLRGLRTAESRMRQISSSALGVAQWLRMQPQVGKILYPALAEHPQHALFKRDFSGASGLFSFEIKPEAIPAGTPVNTVLGAICDRRQYFGIGYSWGGFESLIVPARIEKMRNTNPWVGGPLIRINIGLEHPADLMDDLAAGFKTAFGNS
jgi:cysteine-S-conjugate beta-lyase